MRRYLILIFLIIVSCNYNPTKGKSNSIYWCEYFCQERDGNGNANPKYEYFKIDLDNHKCECFYKN